MRMSAYMRAYMKMSTHRERVRSLNRPGSANAPAEDSAAGVRPDARRAGHTGKRPTTDFEPAHSLGGEIEQRSRVARRETFAVRKGPRRTRQQRQTAAHLVAPPGIVRRGWRGFGGMRKLDAKYCRGWRRDPDRRSHMLVRPGTRARSLCVSAAGMGFVLRPGVCVDSMARAKSLISRGLLVLVQARAKAA